MGPGATIPTATLDLWAPAPPVPMLDVPFIELIVIVDVTFITEDDRDLNRTNTFVPLSADEIAKTNSLPR
jgi:hypothetical protein